MRNVKMLGLLAVLAMVLTAFAGASSASAASFTSAGAGNALSTSLVIPHAISVEGSEIVCEEVAFTGATEGASTTQQIVSPSYKKCAAFGGVPATVATGSCDYEFKGSTVGIHATLRLFDCTNATEGIKTDVNVPFVMRCVVDMPQQSIGQAFRYSNPNFSAIRFSGTMWGVMNDVTVSTGICPWKVGTNSNGAYSGTSDLTAAGGMQYSP